MTLRWRGRSGATNCTIRRTEKLRNFLNVPVSAARAAGGGFKEPRVKGQEEERHQHTHTRMEATLKPEISVQASSLDLLDYKKTKKRI